MGGREREHEDQGYRVACLRLPQFPLQCLLQQRPAWRGRKVAWLEQLKPDSPLRYLTPEAQAQGLSPGMRYATALGLVPDLLAGTGESEDLAKADRTLVKALRHFTPCIRRGSEHLGNGLYLLDAQGLDMAFGGMKNWSGQLLSSFEKAGWQAVLAVGYTPFACEMATYHLSPAQPLRMFVSREQEQEKTMRTPLASFGLSPDQVRRLQRFGITVLESFLALDGEEVRCRFGADLVEFYAKASEALFAEFTPLPEEEPLWDQFGLPEPAVEQEEILQIARLLLDRLLPRLIRKEEGVGQLLLWLITEEGEKIEHRLLPSYPTVDARWLGQLLRLRLEKFFQQHPLRWGHRIERVIMALVGEPDPEKQGELFSSWAQTGEEALLPRDRDAALWALSRVRAEYGEGCLRRARLVNHPLPGRDYVWANERESRDWFEARDAVKAQPARADLRVRRFLSEPLPISGKDRWQDKEGPFLCDGGWWESSPYARQYFFAREGNQTGWLYWDETRRCWYAQGWLS